MTPLQRAKELIAEGDELAYDLAAEYGQHFDNIKHMVWFRQALAERIQEEETA